MHPEARRNLLAEQPGDLARARVEARQLVLHAQEEARLLTAARILIGLDDVRAVLEEELGDARNDAGAIRALHQQARGPLGRRVVHEGDDSPVAV